ncbi:hypothetical protein FHW37_104333 [Neorhizobium alkalisoli]|jgi:hypothetical protein|uniref:Uncharacterized protein n=1 Tax=Neorhizobium alkalisoli TaxID=528178 RepID=A0A561QRY4_9HYPH|nr:hypothetical protein FHW37_104333 [Neorhizobium alkalisoli]
MPILISVVAGLVLGGAVLAAVFWWAFRPWPKPGKSLFPEPHGHNPAPDTTIVTGTGNDMP